RGEVAVRLVSPQGEKGQTQTGEMIHAAERKPAQVPVGGGRADPTSGTAVTVNSVLVAPTWSDGVESFLAKAAPAAGKTLEEMRTAYFVDGPGHSSLLQRWAAPEEIAAQVVFLCSERASAVNGAAQRVDGGVIRSLF